MSVFFSSHVSISLFSFFSSPGVSSDPALHPDLYPRRSYEADHPASPEPASAAVWTEELRVHLPHPRQHAQCAGSEVQQHQHTVSEDNGKAQDIAKPCSEIAAVYRGEISCNLCSPGRCECIYWLRGLLLTDYHLRQSHCSDQPKLFDLFSIQDGRTSLTIWRLGSCSVRQHNRLVWQRLENWGVCPEGLTVAKPLSLHSHSSFLPLSPQSNCHR